MIEVQVQQIVGVDRPPKGVGRGGRDLFCLPDQLLELVFDILVELEAAAVQHLEAVVSGRVVRGGNHDAGREITRRGDVGQGRSRNHADHMHVDAEARRSGHDGGYEHVAGAARVLPDDDAATSTGQAMCRRAAKRICEGRLQVDVGRATNSVRAEESGQVRAPNLGRVSRWVAVTGAWPP